MQYDDSENLKLVDKIKNFLKVNYLKIGFLIIALIIVFVVFYYFTVYPRNQKKQANDADLKAKCDTQSLQIFNETKKNVSDINYTYKNHFIVSLGRCYILVHGVGVGDTGLSDKLFDVFRNEKIAECESYATAPEIDFCFYSGSPDKVKYNIDQYNSFIKQYMETN